MTTTKRYNNRYAMIIDDPEDLYGPSARHLFDGIAGLIDTLDEIDDIGDDRVQALVPALRSLKEALEERLGNAPLKAHEVVGLALMEYEKKQAA